MAKYSCQSHSLPASAQTPPAASHWGKSQALPTACKALQTWPLSPPCPRKHPLPSLPPPRPYSTPGPLHCYFLCSECWSLEDPIAHSLSVVTSLALLSPWKGLSVHCSEQNFSTPSFCSIFSLSPSPSPTPDILCVYLWPPPS